VVSAFYPAIEHGWIDHKLEEVAERAWHAMHSHMREDGVFAGVSFETFPSMDPEHYKKMPVDAMVPWGQGPYLTACMARYRYEEEVSYAAS